MSTQSTYQRQGLPREIRNHVHTNIQHSELRRESSNHISKSYNITPQPNIHETILKTKSNNKIPTNTTYRQNQQTNLPNNRQTPPTYRHPNKIKLGPNTVAHDTARNMHNKSSNCNAHSKAPSKSVESKVYTSDTNTTKIHHRCHHSIKAKSTAKKGSPRFRHDTAKTLRSTGQRKFVQFWISPTWSLHLIAPILPAALSTCADTKDI